ncbi:MAG: methyltransferase [Myxococcales bacterium]|nr:methyltransferase [Myxococcales bacterium]
MRTQAIVGFVLAASGLVDAYAGSGALGLGLAAAGADVVLVESHAPSITLARQSASRAKLRVDAIVGDAAEVLGRLDVAPDAIVLNPPRRGVAPAVRHAIARLAPARLVYVSCEPTTLARDLDHLRRLGYVARAIEPYDQIPLSEEVECLVVLERGPAPPPEVAHRAPDFAVLDKPPHETTTPHPESPISLLDRARTLEGFAEATAVHRLDVGTSGLVLVARTPAHVGALAQALAAGTKTYLALVRGVTRTKGIIRRPLTIDGQPVDAITRYRRVDVVAGHSLLRVRPETGRTHQIRRHLAGLGHPIVGDARHGHPPTNRHFEERYGLDRTFLHCERLELELGEPDASTPDLGEAPLGRLDLSAPLPGDLLTVLRRATGKGERTR